MYRKLSILVILLMLAGCSLIKQPTKRDGPLRDNTPLVLVPQASGKVVYGNAKVKIDASNVTEGYLMIKYSGKNPQVKLQIVKSNTKVKYTYNLTVNQDYMPFILALGNGSYTISVYENISGNNYALAYSKVIKLKLTDELKPFLYPNQFVYFSEQSKLVPLAQELAENTINDLEVVEQVYNYVTSKIDYDKNLAKTVQSGYLPDLDKILQIKKGICFDYAALMSAMLRSQQIPTQLVIGYSGQVYHAWINVYTKETGWINGVIQFDGEKWVRMDPTYGANSNRSAGNLAEFVGDGKNYNAMYFH
jgi:transglutaminase/protease-like cytokinesis protein 3